MAHWLIALTEDNWEVCRRERQLGLSKRAKGKLADAQPGDRLWIYISRRSVEHQLPKVREFRGIAEITGAASSIRSPRWSSRGDEHFASAVPFRMLRELRLPASVIVQELSRRRKYAQWGALVQNAPMRLDDREVAFLERAIGR